MLDPPRRHQTEPSALLSARSSELIACCIDCAPTYAPLACSLLARSHAHVNRSNGQRHQTEPSAVSPSAIFGTAYWLRRAPLLLPFSSSLPTPVIKCPGGRLIESPLALALCSTLFLLLFHALSPRYSTFFSCNKQEVNSGSQPIH